MLKEDQLRQIFYARLRLSIKLSIKEDNWEHPLSEEFVKAGNRAERKTWFYILRDVDLRCLWKKQLLKLSFKE